MPVKAVSFVRPRQAWIRAGVTVHQLAKLGHSSVVFQTLLLVWSTAL
jgi:hypothetical protein